MTTYITTGPIDARLVGRIETLIPRHCRSVTCLHGDTDADPVTYRAHENEMPALLAAIERAGTELRLGIIG